MPDTHDPEKPKKGLSRLKLDIPLLGKRKKKLSPIEKKAAEYLSTRRGKAREAVHCNPDSAVRVVIDKDEAVLQVELFDANAGDKEGDKELDAPPASPNLTKLYEDCFEARKSYQLALDAFIAHENKRGRAAASPTSSSQTPARAPEPDMPTRMSPKQLEESIKQIGGDIDTALDKLQDVKGKRDTRQQEQFQVVRGLRRCFHKFADHARDVKSYVSLVPKSAGFGLGGLQRAPGDQGGAGAQGVCAP
ncbi:hypothetical protein MAPG_07784 [Magnaporthiopsis poae ATCC 64411]|uniref:Uncharacterized protein n=1 Tax=Magnaporthiopsis poae (strain ATCC 64411 / 73-15) TaxID=644358 RepID=A0A0C4E5L2_MAGP6|nr:hypothetical protein MAPG_07784 [Magnaporthiopsis poae ATCC 64411]